jgi:aldehyde dehydrogenase (NAD+)
MKGRLLIDGRWRETAATHHTFNPSDLDEPVGSYAVADTAMAEEALAAARRALPAWSRSNIQQRADLLRRVGDLFQARSETIGELLSREEGKTRADGIAEARRAAQVFHYLAGNALRQVGQFLPGLRDGHNVIVSQEPLGVVALITPWNFPLAVPAWKTAAALAYGNTLVLKPSEFAGGCSVVLAELLQEAGLPDGVFNLLLGKGRELGKTLVEGADGISFTGGNAGGQQILQQAALSMTKAQLELGGKNPLIVLDDADLELAVQIALDGCFFQTGQRCTASSRLIVTRGIHDAFVESLAERVRQLRVGHAQDTDTQIGPVATAPQLEKNLQFIEGARRDGAECVAGGGPIECRTRGYYLAPTLFAGTNNAMTLNREEVFGPVVGVIRVDDFDEAMAVSLDCEYALTAGICTNDLRNAEHFRRSTRAGMAMINTPTAGIEYHAPFGGRKPSGFGARELGAGSAEFFTEGKTSYINYGAL